MTGSLVLAGALAGCTSGGAEPGPTLRRPTSKSAEPTQLTFGVYGPKDEVEAFQGVAKDFNAHSDHSKVQLRSWGDHDDMVADLEAGPGGSTPQLPDVFLASRQDLTWLQDQHLTQPVDTLLDERGVDFGDGYSREALQAFSADNRLQCMPFALSPTVIFYNADLVDFAKMAKRGIDAPDPEGDHTRWTFDQFTAAARFATKSGKKSRGVYIAPTLRGLAPFLASGGGSVFDDEEEPTSLAFSSDGSRDALTRTLDLLRDPHVTLSEGQLAHASPLTWFERGRLGMVAGTRALVPELRKVPGLDFDVMPMPVLDSSATVGDVTGLCLSAKAASSPEAADFLVSALSARSVGRVARAGYIVPANLEVAASDDFLQPGRMPAHGGVFNNSVRAMHVPPLIDSLPELQEAVSGDLHDLLTVPVLDLEAATERIDEKSRAVLSPESASPSPSEGTSESPS